jgi:two-component system chemotaxis sensor kinase CheA
LDSFDIDMELLRRIGAVRRTMEELEGGSAARDALAAALNDVRERTAGSTPGLEALLDALDGAFRDAPDADLREGAPLGEEIVAAVAAAEQFVFSPDDSGARELVEEASSRIARALGSAPGSPKEGEPPPPLSPSLDDLAAFLVRMDPEDKGQATRLRDMASELLESGVLPSELDGTLEEVVSLLEDVTVPPRTRKKTRAGAVEKVSELLEEASLRLEEMEASVLSGPRSDPEGEEDTPVPAAEAPAAEAPDPLDAEAVEEDETAGNEGVADVKAAEGNGAAGGEDATDVEEADGEQEDQDESTGGEKSSVMDREDEEDEDRAEEPLQEIPSSEPLPEGIDPDLLADFVTEGFEYLAQAEEALLALESDPGDKESVNVVFRAFHTIKGVSGFLELHRISELSHHAETLLSKVRDDELTYSGALADLSLQTIDVLKALLAEAREGGETGVLHIPPSFGPLFRILSDPELPEKIDEGEMESFAAGPKNGAAVEGEDAAPAAGSRKAGENSVRVRTDRLDSLVDMVGELVIAHSMLAQDPAILRDRGGLSRKVDHTNKILRELQDLSTALRMVPLKPAFRKVARVIRDLSRKSGKPVRLVSEGEDTEIDRTMVDVLADPLVHMVRNSVDHGLESPDEREAAGKPREGVVRIKAYQAGGNVVIEVSDDGRGLDRDRILAKARERGVVESGRSLTDQEVYHLIFAPGFSTAASVTEVSGRGVGMDVVRRNVESLRGRVTIDSTPGRGSTFSIHLPLTLAITDGMVVRVGSQRYIIPSVKIETSLRPEAESLSSVSGKGEMVLFQGELLPVVRLHRLWGIVDAEEDPTAGLLVIAGEGSQRAAILVDEMVTQQQFVVKPLTGIVSETQGVAGGAIMGNGGVGLILDPDEIASLARGMTSSAAA